MGKPGSGKVGIAANQRRRKRMTQKEREAALKARRLRKKLERIPPSTPLMLRPMEAWRLLCARTGGSIHSQTFYKWIDHRVIPSIRLGTKIFIPKAVLENVIKHCLAGVRL